MKLTPLVALIAPLAFASSAFAQSVKPEAPTAAQLAAASAATKANPSMLALYLAGNAALGQGQFSQAADFFARAAALSSDDARDTLNELAFESYVQGGDIPHAAKLAPQEDAAPQTARQLGQLVVAVDAFASGDAKKAETILSGSGVGQPFRQTALMLRPWAAAAAGDKDQAVAAAPSARATAASQVFANYNRALLLEFTGGKPDDIEALYKALLTAGPGFEDFRFSYGAFLERQNRTPDAVKIYDDILAGDPDDARAQLAKDRIAHHRAPDPITAKGAAAQALISQGDVSMAENDLESALAYFWMALRLDDHRTDALDMAANIEASSGSTDVAREHFGKIPVGAPEYVDARISIAETWLTDHKTDKALAAARETVAKAPHDLDAKSSLATILVTAGKPAEAAGLFTQLIKARGEDASWALYYERATTYYDMKQYDNAEKDLNKALDLSPDEPEVLNYLGFMWADQGQHLPAALTMLKKAAAAKPNEGAIIDSLGWVYYRMGDYPNAIENLEKALSLDVAADPSVNDHLGDAYMGAGRKLEALYQWERVLTLHPDDALKAAVQKKITAAKASATVASANSPAPGNP